MGFHPLSSARNTTPRWRCGTPVRICPRCGSFLEGTVKKNAQKGLQAQVRMESADNPRQRFSEHMVLGTLSRECYQKMVENSEAEQEQLKLEIAITRNG